MAKSAIFRQNPHIGTGIESGYRYPLDRGKVVSVPIHSEGLVPVLIKMVQVPMLSTTLFLHTLHY